MSNSQSIIAYGSHNSPADFLRWWPELELVEQSGPFASYEEAWGWCAARDGYIQGPKAHTTKIFYDDRDWRVLTDFSMCMMADEATLSRISEEISPVLIAMTQGTAGCASFHKYATGQLVRAIDYVDGEVTMQGTPIPEEAGIDVNNLYDAELERLWQRHGLSGLLFNAKMSNIVCLHLLDHREERLIEEMKAQSAARPVRKRWFQFW